MINELKVSGAYLVKGFRKWSIWKAITRYHRFTQPEDSTFPSPQAAQLQHVTTKYCFVTILSAENVLLQFVTISFESFFFSFFHCHSLTFAPPCSASCYIFRAVDLEHFWPVLSARLLDHGEEDRGGTVEAWRWAPLQIAFSWFIFVAEKNMVYGRYNELVNGDYNGL